MVHQLRIYQCTGGATIIAVRSWNRARTGDRMLSHIEITGSRSILISKRFH
jgi:hypothetical protein